MSQENVPDPGFLDAFGERFGAAWNSHEPDRLLELMTEDIVYDDSFWPQTMRDHGQVREFLEFLWRALPDLEFEDLEGPFLPTDALTAVYYWRGTGTFTGPMDPPGFAPTRARVAFEGFELLEFRGDRLCRLRIVYDIMDLYRQMGVETTPVESAGLSE
jgi:predicted ester cyclase